MERTSWVSSNRSTRSTEGRLYLFLDKAKQHYKTRIVREYMKKNRATLRVRWIPVGSPAFNVMEECWRQMDNDMLTLRFYSSLGRLNVEIGEYLRTKRFRLDMASHRITRNWLGQDAKPFQMALKEAFNGTPILQTHSKLYSIMSKLPHVRDDHGIQQLTSVEIGSIVECVWRIFELKTGRDWRNC